MFHQKHRYSYIDVYCKPSSLYDDYKMRVYDYLLEHCTTASVHGDGIKTTREGGIWEREEPGSLNGAVMANYGGGRGPV